MKSPSAEQTASLLSLITYTFLDRVVVLGNRLPHLPSDLLPPLADYDSAKNLRKRAFPVRTLIKVLASFPTVKSQVLRDFMNPEKRHLLFGLFQVFKREYLVLSLMIVIQVLAGFASPLGIKQLLKLGPVVAVPDGRFSDPFCRYIETDGANATIKPWFWIACLFLGPTIHSISYQWYMYVAVREP